MNAGSVRIERYSWAELQGTDLGVRYMQIRGLVYVIEQRFRDPDVLDLRGGESDCYDPYSTHFVATAPDADPDEIIGCVRSIHDPPEPLPIETYFPGAMARAGLDPTLCTEVSRFIARHPSFRTRRTVALLLIRSVLRDCLARGLGHTLFIVEENFARWLRGLAIPLEQIDEYRLVPEENGVLAPMAVDVGVCDTILATTHKDYARATTQSAGRLSIALGAGS